MGDVDHVLVADDLFLADQSDQVIFLGDRIELEILEQAIVLDHTRGLDVGPGPGAGHGVGPDADAVLPHRGDGHVLGDDVQDFALELGDVDVRLVGERQDKALLDVRMAGGQDVAILPLDDVVGQVFGRMGHAAELDGPMDDGLDRLGKRPEHRRPGHDDLLADAENDLGVVAQGPVEQVEVLDDDPPVVADGVVDGFDDLVDLVEGQLVADVDVEGMAGEGVFGAEMIERRGLDVDAVIVVGQLQAGKQALDERRLARALGPDDADQQVGRRQEFLGQLTIEELNTLHDIVYRQQVEDIEPTVEERAYCDALILKYSRTDDS